MSSRIIGLVKWFNEDKGFGFISPVDGSKDVFVVFCAVLGDVFLSLFDGELVVFAIQSGEYGPAAASVILCDR